MPPRHKPDPEDEKNWDKLTNAKKQYYYGRRCRMRKKEDYKPGDEFQPRAPRDRKGYLRRYYHDNKKIIRVKQIQKRKHKKLMKELVAHFQP